MPHLSSDNRAELIDALGEAQRIGMLGDRSLDEVIDHSLPYADLIPVSAQTVVDLGSGGGDPGLVIAMARPDLRLTLVDRRSKRTDLLVRLVGRLRLRDRVEVVEADVADLPRRFPDRRWDVVTCRGFGPPAYTAEHAAPLLADGGLLLVTEPPESDGSRWLDRAVTATGLAFVQVTAGVAILNVPRGTSDTAPHPVP